MDQNVTALVSATPEDTFTAVSDLATYPKWLDLVKEVRPDGQGHLVTLQARLGPIARSKQLRMTQTKKSQDGETKTVVFERQENHDRDVSDWKMTATVTPHAKGSHLQIDLNYDGPYWTSVLETLLKSQTESAANNLNEFLKQ